VKETAPGAIIKHDKHYPYCYPTLPITLLFILPPLGADTRKASVLSRYWV